MKAQFISSFYSMQNAIQKISDSKDAVGERAIRNYTSIFCAFYRTIYIFLAKCPI